MQLPGFVSSIQINGGGGGSFSGTIAASQVLYDGPDPSQVAVGGMPAGTTNAGQSMTDMWADAMFNSVAPSISIQLIPAAGVREVGNNVINPTIRANASLGASPASPLALIQYYRGTVAGTLVTTQATPTAGTNYDKPDAFTVSTNQTYTVRVTDGVPRTGTASASYSFILPRFYGKVSGGSKPTKDQALINSGAKLVASSTGTIIAPFSSSPTDWIRFAIPQTSTSKTTWYENALNNGPIGGISNLFDTETIVSINSPSSLWSGVNYKIYVSNYQSATTTLELRN